MIEDNDYDEDDGEKPLLKALLSKLSERLKMRLDLLMLGWTGSGTNLN